MVNKIQALFNAMKADGVDIIERASTKSSMDDGTPYALIKVQDLGRFFNISNPSDYFRKLAIREKEKEFIEMIKQETGRPAMYIAEPLFYSFLFNSAADKNSFAQSIREWLIGKVLVCLSNDLIYTNAMEND